MKIAKHPVLSNAAHAPFLPSSWSTLYELTKLPTKKLEAKLEDGTITAETERKQVRALISSPSSSKKQTPPPKPTPEEQLLAMLDKDPGLLVTVLQKRPTLLTLVAKDQGLRNMVVELFVEDLAVIRQFMELAQNEYEEETTHPSAPLQQIDDLQREPAASLRPENLSDEEIEALVEEQHPLDVDDADSNVHPFDRQYKIENGEVARRRLA
jgi:hypothetical protein